MDRIGSFNAGWATIGLEELWTPGFTVVFLTGDSKVYYSESFYLSST